jgi:isocitrate/isopropylmalate dehydrogenase
MDPLSARSRTKSKPPGIGHMAKRTKITVAHGDGIGPEVMRATLDVLEAAGAPLDYEVVEIGEAAYRKGVTSGIPADRSARFCSTSWYSGSALMAATVSSGTFTPRSERRVRATSRCPSSP